MDPLFELPPSEERDVMVCVVLLFLILWVILAFGIPADSLREGEVLRDWRVLACGLVWVLYSLRTRDRGH